MTDIPTDRSLARRIACEAFIFGYPIVLLDSLHADTGVRPNELKHRRTLSDCWADCEPDPDWHSLSSVAWLDLSHGPVVFCLPYMRGRCFSLTLLDRWTDVFSSIGVHSGGWRGDRGGELLIVGPDWRGQPSGGVPAIRAPSNHPILLLRIVADGTANVANLQALQDKTQLQALVDERAGVATAPLDEPESLLGETINERCVENFFDRLAALAHAHPPARRRHAQLDNLAALGVIPGHRFTLSAFDPMIAQAIVAGAEDALAFIGFESEAQVRQDRHWRIRNLAHGNSDDLLCRAANARRNMDIHKHEQAMHAATDCDDSGKPLDGKERYRIRFGRGGLPVENFWAMSLFSEGNDGRATQAFPAAEYASANLGCEPPREVRIQRDEPEPAANTGWIKAPEGHFRLLLSLFQPRQTLLDGSSRLPRIERLREDAPAAVVRRTQRAQKGEPDASLPPAA